jgi:hypothetical protein
MPLEDRHRRYLRLDQRAASSMIALVDICAWISAPAP